jgi:hypothetical protein
MSDDPRRKINIQRARIEKGSALQLEVSVAEVRKCTSGSKATHDAVRMKREGGNWVPWHGTSDVQRLPLSLSEGGQ